MAASGGASAARLDLASALIEFKRSPGGYALARRQPEQLFEASHSVMLLAAGRAAPDLPSPHPTHSAERIQRAAQFFVRTALLRAGADHYTVLGLKPGFQPADLRDHYRLMIRLTHPDFAGAGNIWPPDAATRINIANDVLGSAEQKARYDASLKPTAPPTETVQAPRSRTTPSKPQTANKVQPDTTPPTQRLHDFLDAGLDLFQRHRPWALTTLGGLACVGLLWLLTPKEADNTLVAKGPRLNSKSESLAPAAVPVEVGVDTMALAHVKAWLAENPPPPTTRPRAAPGKPQPTTGANEANLNEAASDVVQAPAPSKLTMAQVQPQLNRLLNGLRSGQGNQVLKALASEWRDQPAASALAASYQRALDGRRVVRLGKVQLRSSAADNQLVVDGVVELYLQGETDGTEMKALRLSAHFRPHNGQAQLTQVVLQQP
ncbi:MAG: DnaJ domain-containing protein [Burkholderiaceae bacterium]